MSFAFVYSVWKLVGRIEQWDVSIDNQLQLLLFHTVWSAA